MKRIHLFEFTDLSWYPDLFRRFQTDYLQFVASLGSGHKHLIPLFKRAMQSTRTNEIVDLCSGGTGPWIHLAEQLEQAGLPINVTLTDKYPNQESVQKLATTPQQRIKYLAESVDAMNVPESLKGMRTLFEGFHHFKPNQAKLILQDAVSKRTAIGIFEASLKSPLGIILLLLSPLITIASYFFMTPFIKPRTFPRFFWTLSYSSCSACDQLGWDCFSSADIFSERIKGVDGFLHFKWLYLGSWLCTNGNACFFVHLFGRLSY